MAKRAYYVVLEHTGKETIRTMYCFEDKQEFEEWYSMFEDTHKIVEKGVSKKKAIGLSSCIDMGSTFAEAILKGK